MSYKTNQLDKDKLFTEENYSNIKKDFWIYKFTIKTTTVGYGHSLIDEIKQELPYVKSVVYLKGKTFYALFQKMDFKNKYELDDKISILVGKNNTVQYHEIKNLKNLEVNCRRQFQSTQSKRYLAQLLFNSLANTSSENSSCSNITGGLYWLAKTNKGKQEENKQPITWQYITIKLELDYHLHLQLYVKTFSSILLAGKMNFANRKTSLNDYLQYEILSDNIRSMRRLKQEEYNKKPEKTYILAQIAIDKSTVSFLDFSNWTNFERSKSGVLYLFLKEIKEQIGRYVNVKFVNLPFSKEKTAFNKKLSAEVKTRIKAFYQNKPIVINVADSLKNDKKASNLAQNLKAFLTNQECDYKAKNVSVGDLKEDALNIRIINEKKFYKERALTDEYCSNKKYLIHHITIDGFKMTTEKRNKKLKSLPAIDVILKESYIKNDIKKGKITILDWNLGEWLFMEKVAIESNIKGEKKYIYHLLRVLKNGTLVYESCMDNDMFSTWDYNLYKVTYESFDKFNGQEFLKCLLVANRKDVNLIFETPRFTIQEIEEIGKNLELEYKDGDSILSQKNILNLIQAFVNVNHTILQEKDKDSLDKLMALLEKYKSNFSKKQLLRLFKEANLNGRGKNHLQGRFCKFYQEQTGDVLKTFFRGKSKKESLLSSKLDIFYEVNETETEALYFVGESSNNPNNPINLSFQNATNIRKIKAVRNNKGKQSHLVFDQLLETMAVDFVKQGKMTVVPFPFKYLRENFR